MVRACILIRRVGEAVVVRAGSRICRVRRIRLEMRRFRLIKVIRSKATCERVLRLLFGMIDTLICCELLMLL